MKNSVIPLRTSFMVSTTERELNIKQTDEKGLKVTFLGFFGNFLSREEERYGDVQLQFTDVKDFRYFAENSQSDEERIDSYDWEALPEFRDDSGSLAKHEELFNRAWEDSGVCPNPSIYRVDGSSWVETNKGEGQELVHYLILGGDYNLEVLAGAKLIEQ